MAATATNIDCATWFELQALQADIAAVLDSGDFSGWPDFFTEDCIYKLQSRENFDRGLPLATLAFESRGMLKDRVHGAAETIYHDPYYQRHVVGAPRLLPAAAGDDAGTLRCECSYIVIRTKRDAMPEIVSVGRYIDRIVRTAEGLRFAERLAVFDNDLIANSLIYPI